jgi:hypothetical protein
MPDAGDGPMQEPDVEPDAPGDASSHFTISELIDNQLHI